MQEVKGEWEVKLVMEDLFYPSKSSVMGVTDQEREHGMGVR